MNYEERYNQALKVIESLYNVVRYQSSTDALFASQTIEKAFPELKESEDEKIRKWIINEIKIKHHNLDEDNVDFVDKAIAWLEKRGEIKNENDTDFTIYRPLKNGNGKYECIPYSFYGSLTSFSKDEDLIDFLRNCFYTKKECEEWLEKQGEQPSWSDYDERIKRCIQVALTDVYEKRFNDYDTTLKDCLAWLKSLKDRVQPQPKQEWSEEDEKIINTIISDITRIRTSCGIGTEEYNIRLTALNWLKSLKDRIQLQLHWKPSEEEMEALLYALGKGGTYNKEALTQLYNNLKTF